MNDLPESSPLPVEGSSRPDPLARAADRVEFVPESFFKRIPMSELFARKGPVEVDIGCGEGAFIAGMAQRYPDRNFIGIERLVGRVNNVCRIAAHRRLDNIRVIRAESSYVIEHLLEKESVSVAHVLFPDPWPKRYHHPRRLIQDAFMVSLHSLLVRGGELRAKTDDLPYFQWMEKVFARAAGFERIQWEVDPEYPVTNFERRFLDKGMPIYEARLRKI